MDSPPSPNEPVNSPAPSRLYYLDWLRVLIIGGVFIGHAVLPFSGGDWLITTDQTLVSAALIAVIGNQFGMPLLFFISGACVGFSLKKRNSNQYVRERAFRLLVPYVLGVLLLSPVQAYYAALHHGTYQGDFIGYLQYFFNLSGFFSFDLQWAGYYGYHLWFLVFLFAYSVLILLAIRYRNSPAGNNLIDRMVGISRKPLGLLLFALPVALSQLVLRIPFPAYLSWADFAFWGFFYLYGYLFFSDSRLIDALRGRAWTGFAFVMLSTLGLVVVGFFTLVGIRESFSLATFGEIIVDPSYLFQDIRTFLVYSAVFILLSLNTWGFLILFISLGARFLNFTSDRLNRLSETSLPFYIIHHPVIVIIGFYVVRLYIGAWPELILLGVSALIVTLSIIILLISPYDPVRTMIGMRPRAKSLVRPVTHLLPKQVGFIGGVVLLMFALNAGLLNATPDLNVLSSEAPPAPGWDVVMSSDQTTCAYGDPYRFFTRQANASTQSSQLMLYFQAGGACWNAETCGPSSLAYDKTVDNREMDSYVGVFDFNNPENPVVDYDMVFIPSCTGDVHTGSVDNTYTDVLGNQLSIHHQGARNVREVLNWVYDHYAAPEHVVIAGSSAGSIASIYYASEIIDHYPDSRIVQHGDGYVGIIPADWDALNKWNTLGNLPDDIREAVEASSVEDFVYNLYLTVGQKYPEVDVSQFTTAADGFQIIYYNVAHGDMRDWADAMHTQLNSLNQNLENFRSYVAPGFEHTILPFNRFYTTAVEEVRFRDWFADLIAGRSVENVSCERGQPNCP